MFIVKIQIFNLNILSASKNAFNFIQYGIWRVMTVSHHQIKQLNLAGISDLHITAGR